MNAHTQSKLRAIQSKKLDAHFKGVSDALDYHASLCRVQVRKNRSCLRCRKVIKSAGSGNRICADCAIRNQKHAELDLAPFIGWGDRTREGGGNYE